MRMKKFIFHARLEFRFANEWRIRLFCRPILRDGDLFFVRAIIGRISFFFSFSRSRKLILNPGPISNRYEIELIQLISTLDIHTYIYIHICVCIRTYSSIILFLIRFFPFPFNPCVSRLHERRKKKNKKEEKNIERSQYFTPSLCQIFLFARSLLHCPICPRSCHMENRRDFPLPLFFFHFFKLFLLHI